MYLARMFVAANLEHLQLVPQTWTRILLVTEVYIYYTVYCSIRGIPLIIYFVLYCIVYFRSIVTTVKPLPQATLYLWKYGEISFWSPEALISKPEVEFFSLFSWPYI